MIIKTENEIIENWIENSTKPIVSICCTTYNHEKYISTTLDSLLMQETNFAFEILIHDDASTDNTQNIIKKYQEKFPLIIKPILQIENQYSKGYRMNPVFNFPRAKGKYLAICEGDDYWSDSSKLQLQIDIMDKNPKVSLCFHPSVLIINDKEEGILSNYSNKNKIFSTSDVILGGGDFCPTASLVIRKNSIDSLPIWFFEETPVGDYFLQILSSVSGGAFYISKSMSVYRRGDINSWTSRMNSNDKLILHNDKMNKSLKLLDDYLNNKFSNEINKYLGKNNYRLIRNKNINLEYRKKLYQKFKFFLPFYKKILWHLKYKK